MARLFKKQISQREIATFTTHLEEFLHAGIPLLKALELIEKEYTGHPFQPVLHELASRIRQGESFAQALTRYPALFNPFYQNLIQAGEASGKLETVLRRLSTTMEKDLDLRSKVNLALAYPLFVLAFGFFTIIFLMIVIVPKISAIYTDFGGTFPLITIVVLAISDFILKWGWIFLLLVLALSIYYSRGQAHQQLRRTLDRRALRFPGVRELVLQAELARFGRTLGMLLESGISLITALGLAISTVGNHEIQKSLQGIDKPIQQGMSFVEALRKRNIFPERALNFIWVGESTGNLGTSLERLGDISDAQVDRKIKFMTTLIEPTIIIVVGLIVAVIVVALLLPVFEMNLLIQ